MPNSCRADFPTRTMDSARCILRLPLAKCRFDELHFGGYWRLALLLGLGRLDSQAERQPRHDVVDV